MSDHSSTSPADIIAPGQGLPWESSLCDFFELAVEKSPGKIFVDILGQEFTYRQVHQRVMQTAAMFQSMGLSHGDRVCLFMPNCPEYLFCWFGLSILGAIGVPINTAYKRDEMAFILNDAEAKALVAHQTLVTVAQEAVALAPSVEHKLLVENRGGSEAGGPSHWRSQCTSPSRP